MPSDFAFNMPAGGAPFDVNQLADITRQRISSLAQGHPLNAAEIGPAQALAARHAVSFGIMDGNRPITGRDFVESLRNDREALGSFYQLLTAMGLSGQRLRLPPAPRMSGSQLVDAASESITVVGSYREGDYILVTVAFTGEGPVADAGQVLSQPGSCSFTIDSQSLNGGQGVPFIITSRGVGVTFLRVERPGTTLIATISSKLVTDDEGTANVAVFPDEESAVAWLGLMLQTAG